MLVLSVLGRPLWTFLQKAMKAKPSLSDRAVPLWEEFPVLENWAGFPLVGSVRDGSVLIVDKTDTEENVGMVQSSF